MLQALVFVVFPFCMVYAMISDIVSMTIANRVSILLAATFLVVAPLAGMGWAGIGLHVSAGLLVLGITFALFALGTMGGGDAKLLAATALWMGLGFELVQYVVYASLFGGALTLLTVVYRNSALADVTGNHLLLRNLADKRVGIPYGVALGAAGLLMFPASALGQWAIASLGAG